MIWIIFDLIFSENKLFRKIFAKEFLTQIQMTNKCF